MAHLVPALARVLVKLMPLTRLHGRLVDHTPLSRLRFAEMTLTRRTVEGADMTFFANDHIGRHLYLTGQFDPTCVEVLLNFARPDDRILDIGANVGYVSCALLKRLPACRLAAIEPVPEVHELLTRNVAGAGGSRAVALRAAVSNEVGPGAMVVPAGNRGASHLVSAARPPGAVPVERIAGDQVMARSGLDRVDLIKIDVEGHETQVLQGLHGLLERFRPRAIVFEHHDDLSDPRDPLRRFFEALDYEVLRIGKRLLGWTLLRPGQRSWAVYPSADYLAVPRATQPAPVAPIGAHRTAVPLPAPVPPRPTPQGP